MLFIVLILLFSAISHKMIERIFSGTVTRWADVWRRLFYLQFIEELKGLCVSADVSVVPSETGGCIKKGGSVMLTLSGSWSLRRTRRQTPGRNGSNGHLHALFPDSCGEISFCFSFPLSHVSVCVRCVSLVWSTGSAVWTWMETGCSACTSWSSSTRSSVRS